MIRKTLFTTIFFIISLGIFAQNYQIFKSGYDFYYKNSAGTLMPVRWDDVQITPVDTTFFSFKSVRDTSGFQFCVDTIGGSLLGKKGIKTTTNKVAFINYQNDSIFFFPESNLNYTWSLFTFSDSSYIEAKMTGLITDSLFHTLDTIKVFDLQAKDALGNNIANPFNNKQITLSKNNGFVQLFDFYLFPNDNQTYTLAGENWPDVGNHNIGYRQVYDFQPGDEFHIDYAEVNNLQGASSVYIKTIKKCLSRTDDHCANSIAYLWEICKKTEIYSNDFGVLTTEFQNDTITDTIRFAILDFPRFDHISTEYFLDSAHTNLIPNILTTTPVYHERTVKSLLGFQYWSSGSCWSEAIADPGPVSYDYVQGCGGPYYYSTPWIFGNYFKNALVYFKKGNEIWGTPLAADCNALSVEEIKINDLITVYPNPANDQVNIEIGNYNGNKELLIEIFDYTGKSIFSILSSKSLNSINIESLRSGIYFYRVSKDGNIFKSDRFVVIK
jgi:hypothetical protein